MGKKRHRKALNDSLLFVTAASACFSGTSGEDNEQQRAMLLWEDRAGEGTKVALTSDTDVTGFTAGVFLCICSRQAHELMTSDFCHGAQRKSHRVSVNDF